MSEVYERLKEARLKVGLSTTKVSKIAKVSEGNLSDLEKGAYYPSAGTLLRLSDAYGVSIDWLLKGKNADLAVMNETNREIVTFLREVYRDWEESDPEIRSWIIVQLRRAFPEIAERVGKREK